MRFAAGPDSLKNSELLWRTVCQCNSAIIPQLHDGTNKITFAASHRALVAAGPNLDQAQAHVIEGKIGTGSVTLELKTPRGEKPVQVYAASWNASGNPPGTDSYDIEYSLDAGKSWTAVVKDWRIVRRAPEPKDFWSQSFTWGDATIENAPGGTPLRLRFTNTGQRTYRKVEAYLAYAIQHPSPTAVTFAWREGSGAVKTATHTYINGQEDSSWNLDAGRDTRTVWVEYGV
jgi:hypothetical protein